MKKTHRKDSNTFLIKIVCCQNFIAAGEDTVELQQTEQNIKMRCLIKMNENLTVVCQ